MEKQIELDNTDRKIIELLKNDGRTTNNDISKRLGVSEGTVRNRVRRLMSEGFLRVQGAINPNLHAEEQVVYIGAKIAVSKNLKSVARQVAAMPHVRSVSILSGRYDLLIELLIPPRDLIDFLDKSLGRTGSIVSTESFLTLESFNKWV